jgi:putative lipoic acid-binding regulatory protein
VSASGSSPDSGDRSDPSDPSSEEARARALALLESTHAFPCAYSVTVIAFNHVTVTAEVRRAAYGGPDSPDGPDDGVGATHQSRESSGGKYLSHRLAVTVPDARSVLELYARLRLVEGVVTLL